MTKPIFEITEKKDMVNEDTIRKIVDEAAQKAAKLKEDEVMNKTVHTSSGKSMRVVDLVEKGINDSISCPDGKCKASGHNHHMKQEGDTFVCEGDDCGFKARLVPEKVIEDLAEGFKCKKCGKAHPVPHNPKLRKEDKCYNCGGEEFVR